MKLRNAQFLFLDGQTSGLSPRNAELIELGWSFPSEKIHTQIVRPSDVASIPKKVWQMTGLSPEELEKGEEGPVLWKEILKSAEKKSVAAAVIHYSQFEMPFLQALHKTTFGDEAALPWPVICTYRVAQRLFDDLPARSLRALSGHFGLTLPEEHRAQDHVAATQRIWENLVNALKEKEGIESWEDFQTWWEAPPKPRKKAGPRKYLFAREKRLELPEGPGIYEMYSSSGKILYIGKATSLNSRVNSYFRQRQTTRTRLKELMTQVADIKVTTTATPLEAAILENDRIKEIDPPYNFSLRQKNRQLLFVSHALDHYSQHRDAEHCWGPFTSHEAFESLERLLLIQRGEHHLIDPVLLNYPPEMTKKYLENFLRSLGIEDLSELTLIDLLKAGRFAPPEIEEDTEDEEKLAEASVYRKLRRSVRRIHQVHWLAWLTESRVTWSTGKKRTRTLTVRAGKIAETKGKYRRSRVPFRQRQTCLDLVTYDRMRILLTELTTLAKKGTKIKVQLSPTRFYTEKDLLAGELE